MGTPLGADFRDVSRICRYPSLCCFSKPVFRNRTPDSGRYPSLCVFPPTPPPPPGGEGGGDWFRFRGCRWLCPGASEFWAVGVPEACECTAPPKVCTDFEGPLSLLQAMCDPEALQEEQLAAQARQRAWLKRKSDGDKSWRPKKRSRVAAVHWLAMLNNQVGAVHHRSLGALRHSGHASMHRPWSLSPGPSFALRARRGSLPVAQSWKGCPIHRHKQ